MTEMSFHKSVVKSNTMLRLMCFLLTLYVRVTFGGPLHQQVAGTVLDSPTFVSEISLVLRWCNVSAVGDIWNPFSFVTSKCNRKLPPFDNVTVLNSSVDFDFDSLLCTSLYDTSAGVCYLAHTSNRVNISNFIPDRPIPVAGKFCDDMKMVLAGNGVNFLNGTSLWVEAYNKNIQDERKCTKECIAGEKINPLCKAVVKLNNIILHLSNEVPQTHQSHTDNILKEPPAPPVKSGILKTPALENISPGNSGLAEIVASAVTQLPDDVNTSKKRRPVNPSSFLSKDNKGLRGSTVQNNSELAPRQLNGAKQHIFLGNEDVLSGKASDSNKAEEGDLKSPLSSDNKTVKNSSSGISKKFSGPNDKFAVNGTLVKPVVNNTTPGLTSSVREMTSGSNIHPSAPSVHPARESSDFHSLNNNDNNTQQHMDLSSDPNNNNSNNDGPQNIGHETPLMKQPNFGKLNPEHASDTANVLGNNNNNNREKEQVSDQKKIPEDNQEVLLPTTVPTENVDRTQKMDSSVATGVSNPATVNSQLQDSAQRDSTDETYPELDRIDTVSDTHTLDEDDDADDGLETAPDGEDNVPPVIGEDVLVSEQKTVSKASFPIQSTAEFVKAEDSHFFAYFMTMIVLCIIGYLVFHNKQKILALALEGRSRRGSRRRPNTAGYRKLDSNLEEAVTSQCSSASVTHVIY